MTDPYILDFIGFCRNIMQIDICSQVLTPFLLYLGRWIKKKKYELFRITPQKFFWSLGFFVFTMETFFDILINSQREIS